MLCPQVSNFPPPKTITDIQRNIDLDAAKKVVNMNHFYRSIVVCLPDEIALPERIEEAICDDNEYYKIADCTIAMLLNANFVESFVKNGHVYGLTIDRDCVVQNCIAITPEGNLTLHIPTYIYQTLGIEGTKQPNNYYEIKINLCKEYSNFDKLKMKLKALEPFDFYINWKPNDESICPSSIAKYFYEQNFTVSEIVPEAKKITPTILESPSLVDVEPAELAEWIGLLALEADLTPTYDYVSTYKQPFSETPIKSNRLTLFTVKGFYPPLVIDTLCDYVAEYVKSRDIDNYWASISIQSYEDCPWRWSYSSPSVFQAHDASTSIFLTKDCNTVFSIGQIKFS